VVVLRGWEGGGVQGIWTHHVTRIGWDMLYFICGYTLIYKCGVFNYISVYLNVCYSYYLFRYLYFPWNYYVLQYYTVMYVYVTKKLKKTTIDAKNSLLVFPWKINILVFNWIYYFTVFIYLFIITDLKSKS
jgi:hypothetical protein